MIVITILLTLLCAAVVTGYVVLIEQENRK